MGRQTEKFELGPFPQKSFTFIKNIEFKEKKYVNSIKIKEFEATLKRVKMIGIYIFTLLIISFLRFK